MLYRLKTELVRWPDIAMPSDAPTPALVKVRIADRRISCGIMPSKPAFLNPTLNGRRKDMIGLPLDERQKGTPAHSLLKSPLDNRSQLATSANVQGRLVFSSLRLSLMIQSVVTFFIAVS